MNVRDGLLLRCGQPVLFEGQKHWCVSHARLVLSRDATMYAVEVIDAKANAKLVDVKLVEPFEED